MVLALRRPLRTGTLAVLCGLLAGARRVRCTVWRAGGGEPGHRARAPHAARHLYPVEHGDLGDPSDGPSQAATEHVLATLLPPYGLNNVGRYSGSHRHRYQRWPGAGRGSGSAPHRGHTTLEPAALLTSHCYRQRRTRRGPMGCSRKDWLRLRAPSRPRPPGGRWPWSIEGSPGRCWPVGARFQVGRHSPPLAGWRR